MRAAKPKPAPRSDWDCNRHRCEVRSGRSLSTLAGTPPALRLVNGIVLIGF